MAKDNPTISLAANGKLLITFTNEKLTFAHSVAIPNNQNGLRIINYILSARNVGANKIGQAGNPTQAVIEAWLNNKFEDDRVTKQNEENERHEEVKNFF